MIKNSTYFMRTKLTEEYMLLRVVNLLAVAYLAGFIVLIYHKPHSNIELSLIMAYVIVHLSLFFVTFFSSSVRCNAEYILYALYFTGSLTSLYTTSKYNFNVNQIKFLYLAIFGVILLVKRIRFLKVYILITFASLLFITLEAHQSSIDKFNTIGSFLLLFMLSYFNLKSKIATQKVLGEREGQIRKMAFHDELTCLPNRRMLNDFIKDLLDHDVERNNKCGVMYIDLDNFKNVNDSFGHSYGDNAIIQAAGRLNNCICKNDTIFRFGGDEFIIVLKDVDDKEAITIAERILMEFRNVFILGQYEAFITPSIGISFYPKDGNNEETLIKNADAAMYKAKESGRNNYKFFSKEIDEALQRKMELENGLRRAIINNEFTLHYQPQINLETGYVWGLEALIRWKHPVFGLVSPMEFIPLAEETGLIIPIGEWVLESACRQNKQWQEEGLVKIPVAVNVSAVQLKNSNFVETVRYQIEKSGLDPEDLVIEFTESIMQDTSKSLQIVNDLNNLGVKVAIDDFGTGYSSLSLLKDLNIDILKIDSYFIKDIIENTNTLTIIKLIIDMGNKLNFSIIVEGIENESQAQIIKQNGCKFGQGFLFSFPLPTEKVKEYLKTESRIK